MSEPISKLNVNKERLATAIVFAFMLYIAVVPPGIAQSVPIEKDSIITNTSDYPRSKMISLIDPGVAMIRARGWRCDSISVVQPFVFSKGFKIICNKYNYVYEFKDRGGNWEVNLK